MVELTWGVQRSDGALGGALQHMRPRAPVAMGQRSGSGAGGASMGEGEAGAGPGGGSGAGAVGAGAGAEAVVRGMGYGSIAARPSQAETAAAARLAAASSERMLGEAHDEPDPATPGVSPFETARADLAVGLAQDEVAEASAHPRAGSEALIPRLQEPADGAGTIQTGRAVLGRVDSGSLGVAHSAFGASSSHSTFGGGSGRFSSLCLDNGFSGSPDFSLSRMCSGVSLLSVDDDDPLLRPGDVPADDDIFCSSSAAFCGGSVRSGSDLPSPDAATDSLARISSSKRSSLDVGTASLASQQCSRPQRSKRVRLLSRSDQAVRVVLSAPAVARPPPPPQTVVLQVKGRRVPVGAAIAAVLPGRPLSLAGWLIWFLFQTVYIQPTLTLFSAPQRLSVKLQLSFPHIHPYKFCTHH